MRLLLAEDEKSLSRALVLLLKHNNYSVDAAYDGEEALGYIEAGEYDAVILDIMMPRLDGLSVLRTMRKRGNKTPVIMLTAKAEIEDRVAGLDAGADDYLVKPFATQELVARIRALTRRGDELASGVLEYAGAALDRTTYELSCAGGSVRLGNKEFQLLEMFMLRPERIYPAEQLFDKIWGYDSNAEPGVVWVYISNLRKKLKSVGASFTIASTRNLGYSLGAIGD